MSEQRYKVGKEFFDSQRWDCLIPSEYTEEEWNELKNSYPRVFMVGIITEYGCGYAGPDSASYEALRYIKHLAKHADIRIVLYDLFSDESERIFRECARKDSYIDESHRYPICLGNPICIYYENGKFVFSPGVMQSGGVRGFQELYHDFYPFTLAYDKPVDIPDFGLYD